MEYAMIFCALVIMGAFIGCAHIARGVAHYDQHWSENVSDGAGLLHEEEM